MKKLLVFVLACLVSTAMFAQTHWKMVSTGCAPTNCYVNCCLYIDGALVNNPNYEIGVFDQDDICRGAKLPTYVSNYDWYYYGITCKGYDGVTYHFKIWDHQADAEVTDLTLDIAEEIVYVSLKKYGKATDPYHLNFASSGSTTPMVPWGDTLDPGDPSNIQDQIVPDNLIVVIESGVIVYANDITLGTNSEIVIEDGGQLIHQNPVDVTMVLHTYDYNTKTAGSGYRLIAAPILDPDPTNPGIDVPTAMLDDNGTLGYDLYKFDQTGGSDGKEWRNYRVDPFKLKIYEGYLYANDVDVDAALVGQTMGTNDPVEVNLVYAGDGALKGWNLLGNPFTCKASIDQPIYVLNSTGNEVEASTNAFVMPLQGFFVKATAENQVVHIQKATTSKKGNLNITVNKDLGKVDKAIVSFGNGSSLEKFQLNPNHTKVYMTQNGKDYAVVNAANQGEMPVCFEAEENGTYTLDFSSENTQFSYLHLIDNMTGTDVDLLATPSYSFDAKTTDYASRFRLVFATGSTDESFAFINNGEIILNGVSGNTTVQVFDVTGRMINSTNATNHISTKNMAAGVYMLRLINGDNVMTQKIVVK